MTKTTTELKSRQRRIDGGGAAKGSEGPEVKLHSCLAEEDGQPHSFHTQMALSTV